jgi:hypothetical protein
MNIWVWRAVLTLGFPFILAWSIGQVFVVGIYRTFRDVWLEIRINVGDFVRFWRDGPFMSGNHGKSDQA